MQKYTDEQNVLIAQKEGGADNIFNIYTHSFQITLLLSINIILI